MATADQNCSGVLTTSPITIEQRAVRSVLYIVAFRCARKANMFADASSLESAILNFLRAIPGTIKSACLNNSFCLAFFGSISCLALVPAGHAAASSAASAAFGGSSDTSKQIAAADTTAAGGNCTDLFLQLECGKGTACIALLHGLCFCVCKLCHQGCYCIIPVLISRFLCRFWCFLLCRWLCCFCFCFLCSTFLCVNLGSCLLFSCCLCQVWFLRLCRCLCR